MRNEMMINAIYCHSERSEESIKKNLKLQFFVDTSHSLSMTMGWDFLRIFVSHTMNSINTQKDRR